MRRVALVDAATSEESLAAEVNLANALWVEDRLAEALSWARWATWQSGRLQTGLLKSESVAWRCLGNVLFDMGLYDAAAAAYICSDPSGSDPSASFNRSKVLLGLGAFDQVWPLAEARLSFSSPPTGMRPGPWWQGWPDAPAVTVWHEQGLGDTLQFLRWLPSLVQRCGRIRLLVQPPLLRLVQEGMAWCGSGLTVKSGGPATDLQGCHGSLLSLPWLLNQPEPPWPRPFGYLRLEPPKGLVRSNTPRIGLVWGGGRYLDGYLKERDYRRKSLLGQPLLELLEALAQRPWQLVNLQEGPDRKQAEPAGEIWTETLEPGADFLALAQRLQHLDLLITVDTAAAHLAGAMGLETWLLLPWAAASRWQRGTCRTPWYPTLRLWRQPRHGDWSGLWPVLLAALDQRFATSRSNSAW